MRRSVRGRVDSWLLLATAVGLFGCPLLLDDRFSTLALSEPDAGERCVGVGCNPPAGGTGGSSGSDAVGGSAGSNAAGAAGSSSSGGTTSAGGSGGAGGAAGTGGGQSQDAGGGEMPCRTLELTASAYGTTSNCIGVHGSSNVVVDTGTTLALSYDDGDPCFTGTIANTGWGAVYELTFAGDDDGNTVWNASGAGVTGFEFAYRGSDQPPSLRVIYKDPSGTDNCRIIGPGITAVPFSVAHPDCDSSGEMVDSERLVEMILAFPVGSNDYDVDFCVEMRALD